MTVYADVLFLTNFWMDFLLLNLCGVFCGKKPNRLRLFLAGMLGGVYGTLLFVEVLSPIYSLAGRIFMGAVLCAAVYCPCPVGRFFQLFGVLFGMGFLAAGVLYTIMLYTGDTAGNGIVYLQGVWALIGMVSLWLLAGRGIRILRKRAKQERYMVEIFYADRSVRIEGLLDSGNSLQDPIRKLPVMLAEVRILKTLFSPSCTTKNLAEWVESTDLCWIPYQGVGSEGVFCGFLADNVRINGREIGRTVVACCERRLNCGVLLQHEIILEGV